MARTNELGQPVGESVPNWQPPPRPTAERMEGRYCDLEPLDPAQHAEALFHAISDDRDGRSWTYMPYGPFASLAAYRAWMEGATAGDDPLFLAVAPHDRGLPAGVASYLRINPQCGSIEVGHIHYAPCLQGSIAATEAMFLMMRHAFALGYRRYEWKCDALNAKSRQAAQRLGLSFEGVFRQANVYKGRNRDTAWYAAIDAEWPALHDAFTQWLDPANFDAHGQQRLRLSELTRPIVTVRA